jgi:hypothetical protein
VPIMTSSSTTSTRSVLIGWRRLQYLALYGRPGKRGPGRSARASVWGRKRPRGGNAPRYPGRRQHRRDRRFDAYIRRQIARRSLGNYSGPGTVLPPTGVRGIREAGARVAAASEP